MRFRILWIALGTVASFVAPVTVSGTTGESRPSPYEVFVSISQQRTYVYQSGRLARTMVCSTGMTGTDNATPLGDFLINESGGKRGPWFFSSQYQEGAKYWVGFVGGTYLFHSVPMDASRKVISTEAAKLGTPASHGCVRLSTEDAHWFYTQIPDRTPVHILADFQPSSMGNLQVAQWIDAHGSQYKQSYTLSCEIALLRLALGLMGDRKTTEDQILNTIPRNSNDPERAFVCDDLNGSRRNPDGSIHWNNYGTHPPVIVAELTRRLESGGVADRFEAKELRLDDRGIRDMISTNPKFLGAIVWVVGHPTRWVNQAAVNERGMVLGEHVRFVEPVLTPTDKAFRVYDPETGLTNTSPDAGAERDLFSYRLVAIFAK